MELIKQLLSTSTTENSIVEEDDNRGAEQIWNSFEKKADINVEQLSDLLSKEKVENLRTSIRKIEADDKLLNSMVDAFDTFYELFNDLRMDVGIAIQHSKDRSSE